MRNPFSKKKAAAVEPQVFDGVSITILNPVDNNDGNETVDIVELFDENGDSMVFEILANASYLGGKYHLITIYIEDESQVEGNADVFIMKEVVDNTGNSMLEPLEDQVLINRIYSAFKKASGNNYNFVDNEANSQSKPQTHDSNDESIFFIASVFEVSMGEKSAIFPSTVISLESDEEQPIWTIPSLTELFINGIITDDPVKLVQNEICLAPVGYSLFNTDTQPLFRIEKVLIIGGDSNGMEIDLRKIGVALFYDVEAAKRNGWM